MLIVLSVNNNNRFNQFTVSDQRINIYEENIVSGTRCNKFIK